MSPSWLKKWSCSLCIKMRFLANSSSSSLSTCSAIASRDVVIGFRYGRRFLLCRSLWEWRIWVKRRKRMGITIQKYINVSFHSCANQSKEGRMHKNLSQVLACIDKWHQGWSFLSWCTVQLSGIDLLENHLRKERVICSLTDCTHCLDVLTVLALLPLSHFWDHGYDSFCHMQFYPSTYIFTFYKQNSAPRCNNLRTTAKNTAIDQHYSYRHLGSGLTLSECDHKKTKILKIMKISQPDYVKGHQLSEAIVQGHFAGLSCTSTDSLFAYLMTALQTLVQDFSSAVWERRPLSGDSPCITLCPPHIFHLSNIRHSYFLYPISYLRLPYWAVVLTTVHASQAVT